MSNTFDIADETGKIEKKELLNYLFKVNHQFIPPISEFTELSFYSEKLIRRSKIITARHDEHLIGICAFYCNDFQKKIAYISSISVQKNFNGNGIGRELLEKSIIISSKNKMNNIFLEVSKKNKKAVNFYKKNYFNIVDLYHKTDSIEEKECWFIMKRLI